MTNERVVYIAWSTCSGQFTGAVLLEFESAPSPKEEEEFSSVFMCCKVVVEQRFRLVAVLGACLHCEVTCADVYGRRRRSIFWRAAERTTATAYW